ncbi:MAG: hypothetical protein M3094_06460, partial [Actinomycetia bacterium]|nr:hypothetical protein [Actinomycetes bacterium]
RRADGRTRGRAARTWVVAIGCVGEKRRARCFIQLQMDEQAGHIACAVNASLAATALEQFFATATGIKPVQVPGVAGGRVVGYGLALAVIVVGRATALRAAAITIGTGVDREIDTDRTAVGSTAGQAVGGTRVEVVATGGTV